MKPIFNKFFQDRFCNPSNYDDKKFKLNDKMCTIDVISKLYNISIYNRNNGITNIHISPRTILFPNMERKYINLEF